MTEKEVVGHVFSSSTIMLWHRRCIRPPPRESMRVGLILMADWWA
jgi:hypothetical protein